MNKIIFPLRAQMHGPAVDDIQDALQLLFDRAAILANDAAARQELATALKSECVAQSYGPVTVKVVSTFQDERRLQASGAVDEALAESSVWL